MSWESDDTYRSGLDFFSAVVDGVADDTWTSPTPCAGWSALDVLGHVGQTAEMGADILRGVAVVPDLTDPPGGAVEGEPAAWWHSLAAAARETLEKVDDLEREIDSPVGRRTIREGLSFPAVDLFIHGWDLATATGGTATFPDEAIAFTYAMFDTVPEELARRPGVFAARQPTPERATPTESLIAFCGRDPRWSA